MSEATYSGQGGTSAGTSDFNALRFLIQQGIARINTIEFVKVVAVTPANNGSDQPSGTVDVTPLVNLIDGDGNATAVGTIYKLPYFRLYRGTSAIIMDPLPGDIGLALYAQRDVSAAVVARGLANPGSRRRYDRADGFYLGGFLQGTSPPNEFITFQPGKITVSADSGASTLVLTPDLLSMVGAIQATGDIVAGFGGADQVTLQNHVHQNVTAGADLSGPPEPGT